MTPPEQNDAQLGKEGESAATTYRVWGFFDLAGAPTWASADAVDLSLVGPGTTFGEDSPAVADHAFVFTPPERSHPFLVLEGTPDELCELVRRLAWHVQDVAPDFHPEKD